jgi:polyhydroxybutyrate depolymerase
MTPRINALRVTLIALSALFTLTAVPAISSADNGLGLVRRTATHDGVKRTYYVFVPPGLGDKAKPAPLVFALHDGGGRAERFARLTRLNAAAAKAGVIVVYPEGVEQHWNDGRSRVGFTTFIRNTDDVGFVTSLIDKVSKQDHAVDPKRVYALGMSNGGMMALRLACEAADKIAGVAAVAASLPARMEFRCRPAKPVGVLIVNGTNDPMIPYRGGEVRQGLKRHGSVMSTENTAAFFAQHDGCASAAVPTPVPNRSTTDTTEATRYEYPECRDSRVVLYHVDRGGHTWPGAKTILPERMVGKTSEDFDASAVALAFFKSLPVRK